jgi:membrane-bound serine protease (ClpP class)
MRPSGTVEFDGRRVDAMTEGVMLDAIVWVKCVDVKAGKVIVRQVPKPKDLSEFDIADLK